MIAMAIHESKRTSFFLCLMIRLFTPIGSDGDINRPNLYHTSSSINKRYDRECSQKQRDDH